MTKKKGSKKGYHTHFCLRIVPQGKWKETDRRELLNKLQEHRNLLSKTSGSDYHLFDKLTRIDKRPEGNYCSLCGPLYDILEDKDPDVDTILFLGHHYLFFEEDQPDMITLVEFLRDDLKVKKFQILYLDSLSEIKTSIISAIQLTEVKNLLSNKKINISPFIEILKQNRYEIRTIYDVYRDSYY